MIIAEATTKSGKLVQVAERKREDRSEYYPLEYFVLVDGQDLHDFPHNRESVALPFFQACQEGCEPNEVVSAPPLGWDGCRATTSLGDYVLRKVPVYVVDRLEAVAPDGEVIFSEIVGWQQGHEEEARERAKKAAAEHYHAQSTKGGQ